MFESFVALRYLKSKKNSGFAYVVSWFSFLGIMLGVATLIVVTSVMNGFRIELLEKIVGMKGHVVISSKDSENISNYEKVSEFIKKNNNEINSIIPIIEKQCILIAKEKAKGVLVNGISKENLIEKKLVSNNIKYGNINNFEKDKVFIGKRLAESLNLKVNDKIKLFMPSGVVTPFGSMPKEEFFEIGGVFEVGMNEYDKNIILLPMKSAQNFFQMKDSVTQVDLYINDIDKASATAKIINKELKDRFTVNDWRHSDASIFHAVVVEKNVMTLILSIIIIVAIFNIISGLIMLTNSKIKDIAILRTIGAKKSSILKIFFYIGSCIGFFGTISGVFFGLIVSLNIDKIKRFLESLSGSELFNEEIYFLSQIPSKTDLTEVSLIALFAFLLCFLATIYPAIKASKLDPVEALRM